MGIRNAVGKTIYYLFGEKEYGVQIMEFERTGPYKFRVVADVFDTTSSTVYRNVKTDYRSALLSIVDPRDLVGRVITCCIRNPKKIPKHALIEAVIECP